MAHECRTVSEFFHGPMEHPDPDRHAAGKTKKALEDARDRGIAEVLIEVRKHDAGAMSSDKLFHRFVRGTDDPGRVATALEEAIGSELPESWNGELRINFRDRHQNEHITSFTKQIRGYAPTGPAVVTSAGGVQLVHEVERVRPWVDMLFRTLDRASDLVKNSAELVKAAHPPPPPASSSGSGPMALLQSALEVGRATSQGGQGQAAPAPAAPVRYFEPAYTGGASLPWTPEPPPAASMPGATLPDSSSPAPSTSSTLTREQVERWADENPAEAELVVRARLRAAGFPA